MSTPAEELRAAAALLREYPALLWINARKLSDWMRLDGHQIADLFDCVADYEMDTDDGELKAATWQAVRLARSITKAAQQ